MTSIVFGAVKETIDMRHFHEYMEIESSVLETLATVALIIIRIANARRGYAIVVRSLTSLENVSTSNAHLRAIRK